MNAPHVQPYLFFGGRCEEALAFYQKHLDAEVVMEMTYGESPEPFTEGQIPPNWENKIMHCGFRIGSSDLMGSDGMSDEKKEAVIASPSRCPMPRRRDGLLTYSP